MGPQCFMKKDSKPPVCGVHEAPLVQHHSSDEPDTSFFGDFDFFVCPVSGKVVSGI